MTTIAIHGYTLDLPDDHWLPQIRNRLPNYSENIGRLAAAVECKYPGRGFIDVGANVGDTAAIVRAYSKLPILCIEGSEIYYKLLQENVRRLQADVELECALERFAPLDTILARHPRFQTSKILKIGADGLDGRMLESSLEWIVAAHPVLFWANGGGLSILDRLLDAGYRTALVFDNTSEFIQTISLDARQQLAELSGYLPGGEQFYGYCDLCAFHEEDADLCARVQRIELENRRARGKTGPKPLTQPLLQALVQAQFEMHSAQVTRTIQESIERAMGEAQTAELTAVRAHTERDRYRLQLQIAELETHISLKDDEIKRLHAALRDLLKVEDLKGQVAILRNELDTSLALRAARSLHWILGPIRRLIGGTSNGGRP